MVVLIPNCHGKIEVFKIWLILSQSLEKQLTLDLSKKEPDIMNNPIISQLSSPPRKSKG